MVNYFIEYKSNIKKWLQVNNWKQNTLAQKMGILPSQLSAILKGKKRFHEDHINAIANATGLHPKYFLSTLSFEQITEQAKRNPSENDLINQLPRILEYFLAIPGYRASILNAHYSAMKTYNEEISLHSKIDNNYQFSTNCSGSTKVAEPSQEYTSPSVAPVEAKK